MKELGETHGLRGLYLRNGQEFHVLYVTPDGCRRPAARSSGRQADDPRLGTTHGNRIKRANGRYAAFSRQSASRKTQENNGDGAFRNRFRLGFGNPAATILSISATACANFSSRSELSFESCDDAASTHPWVNAHDPATRSSGFPPASSRLVPSCFRSPSSLISARTRTCN